jgi:hypothetical protein
MGRAWHANEIGRPCYIFVVRLVAVCGDLEAAAVLLGGGAMVVLCRPEAATLGDAMATHRAAGSPPGHRLAALVGDLSDPRAQAAALAMASELFGGEAVLVPTAAAARDLAAPAPPEASAPDNASLQGPKQARSDTV